MERLPPRFFVTGTDTGVGKTLVCAVLMSGLEAVYWKPVQSGEPGDTEWVQGATGLPAARFAPETYRFRLPRSPHEAAARQGVEIELDAFCPPRAARLIAEGAGGVLVPLNDRQLMVDLMTHLGLPVLLVARSGLGTLNHTLLSLEALRGRGLEVLGVVVNGPRDPANEEGITRYGQVRVLAAVEPLFRLDPEGLREAYRRCFGGGG
ncbi:MAG: dethiobiotin synthase [Candidatus Handelsmanbacteria bacterium]|nr:dethiobiotin synthase [Candidatus Handelsmanbacteria bacterium]